MLWVFSLIFAVARSVPKSISDLTVTFQYRGLTWPGAKYKTETPVISTSKNYCYVLIVRHL